MKAEINFEPSISIDWTANEKDVIKRTIVQFTAHFRDTNINWATHLKGTATSAVYTYNDLLKLNSALAEWERPRYENEPGWFLITAKELFEKTEALLEKADPDGLVIA
ncbi:hypothetical protein JMJ58_19385 [Haloterrigena salifodinae]|uniref:Uncharacterized protein n=1 Tax=Haloterrigena salifodinae TaxID=2675099 RepID=A0A8T8DZT5_9EURY|nr:hypothetical protein [Haloterrigena salifodinae]QRV15045.1 hypothetical protein JMJ58_19385 [Haloterrigena salifodinae]